MRIEAPVVRFRDARLGRSYQQLGDALERRFTGQISCLADSRSQQRRFSFFLHHPAVHLDQLIWGVTQRGRYQVQLAGLDHVLVASDTTEANLKATQGYRKDKKLGVTGNNADPGFFLHPGLALCPYTGQPFGCVSLQVWTRQGSADVDYVESQKWFNTAQDVKQLARRVTVVNDREGDIFALWVQLEQEEMFMVTRARQDRSLVEVVGRSGKLWRRLAEADICGHFHLNLTADARERRSARKTLFSLRHTPVTLKSSKYVRRGEEAPRADLYAIEVHECPEFVPDGEAPVVWRLLTNHEVTTFEQALQIVQWYVYRWRIEETFSAFKTRGVDVESTRLCDGEAVMKLGIMAYDSATRVTELIKAREDKTTPATAFFGEAELECMEAILPDLEGTTQKQKNPYPSRTAAWAVWIVARLGHWHGSGKPGLIIITRGLERFDGIFFGYNARKRT